MSSKHDLLILRPLTSKNIANSKLIPSKLAPNPTLNSHSSQKKFAMGSPTAKNSLEKFASMTELFKRVQLYRVRRPNR